VKIKELKERISITEVVEHLGGRINRTSWTEWQPCHCPFHEDRVASSSVNLPKGRFICHGCGVSGDIVDLAKEALGGPGTDIRDAIDWLKERFL